MASLIESIAQLPLSQGFSPYYQGLKCRKNVLIFSAFKMKHAYGTLQNSVLRRIKGKGSDWAFTPSDLADLGDPRSVGKVLTRLIQAGTVRRVRRGVYEIPREHPLIGTVGAGADAVVAAIARRDGLKLLTSGAHAANLLGLSTQVAAKSTYGIQGRSRTSQGIGRAVEFKRRSPKAMMMAERASGWVAEALRNIGRAHITVERLQPLRARLSAKEKKQLIEDLRYAPAWMRPFFLELTRDE